MAARTGRTPSAVVEVLRLLVVVFFAGAGFQAARGVSGPDDVLGPFDGAALGVIVGSCVGYVLGGILGRTTIGAVDRTEVLLRRVDAEVLVAGGLGAMLGAIVAAATAWPVFFIGRPVLCAPLFCFVLVVLAMLGFRVGTANSGVFLSVLGPRAGMAPRSVAAAALPQLIDSSVAIDGRILDVVRAGFLHGRLVVCGPVLAELQGLADAADELRRGKGRRGLETLEALRREPTIDWQADDGVVPGVAEVDAKLVRLCLDNEWALLTLDTNLARAAELAGVRVLNLHALALAVRPPVIVGDDVHVLLAKPGKEAGQAVGYLDDGTMVVAERCRALIGEEVRVHVTSVLTTANGRLVFARPADVPAGTRG